MHFVHTQRSSTRKLAAKWKWSRTKTKSFLEKLEASGLIKTEKSHNKITITIIKERGYMKSPIKKPTLKRTSMSETNPSLSDVCLRQSTQSKEKKSKVKQRIKEKVNQKEKAERPVRKINEIPVQVSPKERAIIAHMLETLKSHGIQAFEKELRDCGIRGKLKNQIIDMAISKKIME